MLKIIVIFFLAFASCQAVTDYEQSEFVDHGHEAELKEVPWQAAVQVKEQYRCLGVLLDKTHVLTTNKCVNDKEVNDDKSVTVNFGVFQAADVTNARKALSIKRDEAADLAVLVIEEVIFTDIILGIKVIDTNEIEKNAAATSSGWGMNNTHIYQNLQFVELDVSFDEGVITSITNANHACMWDQGTALTMIDPILMTPILIGIAKQNKVTCEGEFPPSEYISTFQHKAFIAEALKP